ncbi:MAG: hypothetical protein H6581_17915 [Bacteroidia bacterium]|nr:hypothetical protein [Bacteroidia bacterium]
MAREYQEGVGILVCKWFEPQEKPSTNPSRASMQSKLEAVFECESMRLNGRILSGVPGKVSMLFQDILLAADCACAIQRELRLEGLPAVKAGLDAGDLDTNSPGFLPADESEMAAELASVCISGGIFLTENAATGLKDHFRFRIRPLGKFRFEGNFWKEIFAMDNDSLLFPDADWFARQGERLKVAGRESQMDRRLEKEPSGVGKKLVKVVLAGFVALILVVLGCVNFLPGKTAVASDSHNSLPTIAVLPFRNLVQRPENEYFSDGMTEDILSLLARIDGLVVLSRNSVMRYKNTQKSNKEIGEELKADHLLLGTVDKLGSKVDVTIRLVQSGNDHEVWSGRYDRNVTDIFELESQVARDVAQALETKLSAETQRRLGEVPTGNISAYELYLRGRDYYLRYTDEDNQRAISLFRRAIALDSTYALAWAGLGDALGQHAVRFEHGKEILDSSMIASRKAIALNPDLSEGYKSLGLAYHYKIEYNMAREQYAKAIELNPSNDMATANLASIAIEEGNFIKGIFWARKTLAINPLSTITMTKTSEAYYLLGDNVKGRYWAEKAIQADPGFSEGYEFLFFQLIHEQKWEAAEALVKQMENKVPNELKTAEMRAHFNLFKKDYAGAEKYYLKADSLLKLKKLKDDYAFLDLSLGYVHLQTGRKISGEQMLKRAIAKATEKYYHGNGLEKMGSCRTMGMAYAILGNSDRAVDWLETGFDLGLLMTEFQFDIPYFESIMHDPAFLALQTEMKLKATKMREELVNVVGEGVKIGEIVLP